MAALEVKKSPLLSAIYWISYPSFLIPESAKKYEIIFNFYCTFIENYIYLYIETMRQNRKEEA